MHLTDKYLTTKHRLEERFKIVESLLQGKHNQGSDVIMNSVVMAELHDLEVACDNTQDAEEIDSGE
jgi:hypothetical protein